jgi:hypothetical protein
MLRPHARIPRLSLRRRIAFRARAGGIVRKLLTFIVLAAVLVALLPFIVVKTPLLNAVLAKVTPNNALRLTAHDASFSWLGGSSVSGIEAKDDAGNLLFVAQRVSIDRAPGNLLMSPRKLGTIEIVQPVINLTLRPDGSNIEDVAGKLMANLSQEVKAPTASDSTSAPVAVSLKVVAGTIVVNEVASGRQWRIEKVDLNYIAPGAVGGLGQGSLTGQIAPGGNVPAGTPSGRFTITLKQGDAGRQELNVQLDSVALALTQPVLSRFLPGSELGGALSGQGTAEWTVGQATFPTDLKTSGTLAIDRLDATAPALAGDRVRLLRVEMPWRLASQPDGLAIEDLQLRSEVARVAVRGRLDPRLLATSSTTAAPVTEAMRHDIELRSSIDVPRIAAMLPHALRIRRDTTITAGAIDLDGRCQPSDDGQLITGSLRAGQLAATSAGRQFNWDQPVSANFALHRAGGAMRLDSLKCDSKFLRIEAAGTPQQFTADANFDLNSLAEQLGQFIDLSGTQLAGTGTAKVTWQQTDGDKFTAAAASEFTQLRVALGGGAEWTEPQLALRAEAGGVLDPITHRPVRVDNAQLQVNGQGDQLDARLSGAVSLTNSKPLWPIAVRASGSIAHWLTRARPWLTPGAWQIDGQSELAASVRVTDSAFEATDTKLIVNELKAISPGWNINESRVEFSGDARFDSTTSELAANSIQLVTSTVSLAAKDVRYTGGAEGISQLGGVAAFRTDLARLASWRATPNQSPPYQPKGEFTGNVRFAQQAGRITGEINASGQNLELASLTSAASRGVPAPGVSPTGYQTIWQEPQLTLRGATSYDMAADRLSFDQFLIQSNTLQANASGQIERLSTAAECNLNGSVNYDLAQVTPLLWPYVGKGIQLSGREQARFALAGKLADDGGPRAQLTTAVTGNPYSTSSTSPASAIHWSRRVHAQLEFPWGGANIYGLPVGRGRLAAKLGDGGIRVEPISLTVGEGQLTAAPNIRFDPEPAELTMPAGPVLTNVRISPEVSEAMLKYVAPILAGSTQSEGQFSLQLQGARVPLGDAKKADSAGQLTVHSVRVVPGSMARPIVELAQQVEAIAKRRDPTALASRPPVTLLAIRDQQVNFRVLDGRVHHQNLEFQVGDVTIRSQGSVGLDETVSLTLQVPIQESWISKEPLLAGLKGQSLSVPVAGTLTRPQLDGRAVASLSGQLIQSAAGQAVGGELNKALDKLFKSR